MSATQYEAEEDFVDLLRHGLGLRPIEREGRELRISQDGKRTLTVREWATELGTSRQAICQRYESLQRRLKAGDEQAHAIASCPLGAHHGGRRKAKTRDWQPYGRGPRAHV